MLMLRKEDHMGARRVYIDMRRQVPELGPMSMYGQPVTG